MALTYPLLTRTDLAPGHILTSMLFRSAQIKYGARLWKTVHAAKTLATCEPTTRAITQKDILTRNYWSLSVDAIPASRERSHIGRAGCWRAAEVASWKFVSSSSVLVVPTPLLPRACCT